MTPARFLAATAVLDWSTLDDIQAQLTTSGYWDAADADPVLQRLHLEEMLSLTDADEWPLFGQMERPDGQRVWKQEAAFTAEDYAAIIAYHVEQVRHAQYMVQATTAAYRHDN
ncbi:MAG: hypothetical protein E6J80_01940 [Deltaproteobacteria bacterium]|nr:MAG: hypothetical protein E6J80_01940 [Deltaproteobacteria bacterium]